MPQSLSVCLSFFSATGTTKGVAEKIAEIDLSAYSTVFVGYPIWWGEEPRIMDTFAESNDFGDALVIPFCTSSSSGIGRSGKNLADHAESGSWLEGSRFSGNVSEEELRTWIDGLN